MSMKAVSWYIGSIKIMLILLRACELIANTGKKKDEPDCDYPNDLDYF